MVHKKISNFHDSKVSLISYNFQYSIRLFSQKNICNSSHAFNLSLIAEHFLLNTFSHAKVLLVKSMASKSVLEMINVRLTNL
jgi:hypothetical protein